MIIKGIVTGENTDVYAKASSEFLSESLDLFSKYFNIIFHHDIDIYPEKNTCLIYTSYFLNSDRSICENCSSEHSIYKIPTLFDYYIDDVFFENRFSRSSCNKIIDIMYYEIIIGKYCPCQNILYLSDVVHSTGNRPHIAHILTTLEKDGIIHKIKKIKKKYKKITLGTDPEFESVVDGKIQDGHYLPMLSIGNKVLLSHDGMSMPQREIRPKPSSNPEELVENIKELIKFSHFIGEELYASGNNFPLGGHIHIGCDIKNPSADFITLFDWFLQPFDIYNSCARKESKYGKKGDIRNQPHGFEYRTPPSAWLTTPKLALMTLSLVKIFCDKYLEGKDIFIGDVFTEELYKESLLNLNFSIIWIEEFLLEIKNIQKNIQKPLSENWNVSIPQEYKISRKQLI